MVDEEPRTTVWFSFRLGPSSFGIFDTFPDASGRQAHLQGAVASALKEKGPARTAGWRGTPRSGDTARHGPERFAPA